MPRNFVGSSTAVMKAVMQTRSSRLVRTKNISEMRVLAEVHHLVDLGEQEEQISQQLPICVKEVCSHGPGVVTVKFRIEVSANNGVVMGTVDIDDDEQDLKRIAGREYAALHLQMDRSKWDMSKMFEHIVLDRLVLDMSPRANLQQQQLDGGRRAAISVSDGAGTLNLSASVITLKRDELEEGAEDASQFDESAALSASLASSSVKKSDELRDDNAKVFWLRIHSRTHRIVGRPLRTVVLFQGKHLSLRTMETSPDDFFAKVSPVQCFALTDIVFRSKDALEKTLYECVVPGQFVMKWLPGGYHVDLTTKFRRNKFGAYLTQKLSMRFLPHGDLELYANGLQDIANKSTELAATDGDMAVEDRNLLGEDEQS